MPDGDLSPEMRAAVTQAAAAVAAEFARQASLQSLEALPLETLAAQHDIPLSTLDFARRKGKGPRVFHIGRRVYCLRADWNAWLQAMAASGGTGNLNPPRHPPKA